MKNIFVIPVLILILGSCRNNSATKSSSVKPITPTNDSVKKRKTINSLMSAANESGDDDSETFKEVLNERIASYNKVENIDKLIIDGKDSLQLHIKYYCLHDSSLTIPKKYLWGGDTSKDFVTNNFASKILIINNKDTVFNKIVIKKDFNGVVFKEEKDYAILFNCSYNGYDKAKGEFAIGYSISIPLTDVGVPVYIVIEKKGKYKILDEYANMDAYKK